MKRCMDYIVVPNIDDFTNEVYVSRVGVGKIHCCSTSYFLLVNVAIPHPDIETVYI